MSTATLHNEKKKTLVPQLRFQEFDGEWEKCLLDDVTKYVKGFAFKSEDYQENGVRIVRVSDLSTDRIKNENEKVYIDESKSKLYDKYKLNSGNIIITTVGSKPEMIESAVGRGIYIHNDNEGLLNQNMLKFENIKNVDNGYIIGLINTKRYQHYMKSIARGNANQSNITVVDLLQYQITIPTLPEQQKIASFLSAVDEKIQQLTRKATLLEQYKKGVMQQLFSYKIRLVKEGQLRRGCLGDFGFFYYGKGAPKTSVFKDAKTPCVRYGELYSTYKEEIKKIKSYTNIDPKELKLSKGGEVLVPRVGEDPRDFANCSYLPFPNVAIGEMISVYNTDEDGLFMTYYINAMLKKQLAKLVEGGNVSNLYFRYVETIEIEIPSKEEQEKIVKFLKALDSKIEKVNQQLAQTQTFKKGLLQQMFV